MRKIIKQPKITWVDVKNPTPKDVQYLKRKFNFHPLILEELIPPGHRAKVECYPDYLFMILRYPVYNKEKRDTEARELDVIITKKALVTSHYQPILPLDVLFDTCSKNYSSRKMYMSGSSAHLLFYLLSSFWKSTLTKLERIDKKLDQIEEKVFKGEQKEMVLEISFLKNDIIDFWRIIEPQKEILQSFYTEGTTFFGKILKPYFEDMVGTYNTIWNEIKTYKEAISALEDTNQSLLSTKTNEIIRVLTIFSVIVLPLTLMASIWGMNISLPFAESSQAFLILGGIMAFLVGAMTYLFKKKNWL